MTRMAGFRFLSSELEQEIKALSKMSAPFFERSWPQNLTAFLSNFQSIKSQPVGSRHELVLHSLRTRISEGEYEARTKRKGKKIYAIISGIWQIRVHSSGPKQQLEFCGKASLTTEIFALSEPCERLAMWQLDLGAKESPGCYVHAQIPWGFDAHSPGQNSIPIPRLPCFFVTPMSAVEFVLGELFQDEWRQSVQRTTGETNIWYRLQKKWLKCLFMWYLGELEGEKGESSLSPWIIVKTAKPDGKEFVENK